MERLLKSEESELLNSAMSAERSHDYATALNAWQRLASTSLRPEFFCKAGRTAMKLERWVDAEQAFVDALKADQAFALAMLLLGSLFLKRKDREPSTNARTAKAWIQQAAALAPNAAAFSLLGSAQVRLEEREAAKLSFRKAIDLDSSYEEAYFNLGLLLTDDGEYNDAERLLRMAIQLDPAFHEAHGQLGVLLQQVGRYSEAEAELTRAIEIDPDDSIAGSHLKRLPGVM